MLIELIIVILFFSVSSAICMNILASAKNKADDGRDINSAVIYAQSFAECYKSVGDIDKISDMMDAAVEDNTLIKEYGCGITLTMSELSSGEDLQRAAVSVSNRKGEIIFEITVARQQEDGK